MTKWCEKNLRISNPDYIKKARMGFWLGNTPRMLHLYEIRGNELILPFGVLRSLPKEITDNTVFDSEFAPCRTVDFKADVPLYDYQETAVQAMIEAKYGILQSAAGSGKTQMGIAIATRLKRRTLWLCHTLDLVKQSMDRAKQYMSEDLIGTITGGKVNIGEGITFATIQTMCKLDLTQYRDYWDCIITDEVGGDRTPADFFYADEINKLEDNLKSINANTVKRNYGTAPTYKDNGKTMDFKELNRLESATLDIYNRLTNQYENRRTFKWNFGIKGDLNYGLD